MADETKEEIFVGDTVILKGKLGKTKKGIVESIDVESQIATVKVEKKSYRMDIDKLKKSEPDPEDENETEKEIKPEDKTYKVIFRENRTHELFVGVEKIIFAPNGVNPIFPEKYTKGLPHSVISHVDFQSQKSYFTIVEIK